MAIKGLNNVNAILQRKIKSYRNGIREAVREVGGEIEVTAKMYAPPMVDGLIHGKIVSNQNGYGFAIMVDEMPGPEMMRNMPVYLEFGTGLSAAYYVNMLPEEWQIAARKYYINGKGKTKSHSYLFPSWNTKSPSFIERCRKVLKG